MLGLAVGSGGEEEIFINLHWNNTSCHFSIHLPGSLCSRE